MLCHTERNHDFHADTSFKVKMIRLFPSVEEGLNCCSCYEYFMICGKSTFGVAILTDTAVDPYG